MSLPDVIDRILPRTAAVLRETALFGLLVGGSAAGWAAQWIRGQSNRNDPHLDWSPIGSRCSSSTHNGDAPTDVSSANPCLRPLRLRGVTLKNRIVRAAAFGGGTIDQLITTHVEVAKGGAALTTVGHSRPIVMSLLMPHYSTDQPAFLLRVESVLIAVRPTGGLRLC